MYARLVFKLANCLDGIDVTDVLVGDVIERSEAKGAMLIAEGWVEKVDDEAAKAAGKPIERTG